MDPEFRHKLVHGWFRSLLGIAQMTLAFAGAVLLLHEGLTKPTCTILAIVGGLTLLSRFVFHGR